MIHSLLLDGFVGRGHVAARLVELWSLIFAVLADGRSLTDPMSCLVQTLKIGDLFANGELFPSHLGISGQTINRDFELRSVTLSSHCRHLSPNLHRRERISIGDRESPSETENLHRRQRTCIGGICDFDFGGICQFDLRSVTLSSHCRHLSPNLHRRERISIGDRELV
jgi:hypothetical protein